MTSGNFGQRPALVLLSGLPGVGKTTLARRLAAVLPAEHLESDAVRAALASPPTYSPDESGRVFRLIQQRAAVILGRNQHAIVDATNLKRRDRRRFVRLAVRLDVRLIAVRVTVPEEIARGRLADPRDGFSQAGVEVFEMMKDRVEPFAMPVVVVDTRFDLQGSIDLVAALSFQPGGGRRWT
jgi:predicted kinase